MASLERHLSRERDLRTGDRAAANVLYLKNAVVRFVCARDDRERITMFASVAKILSLGPEEVEAVEARLAEPPGLVSRIFDADLPFFGR